MALLGYESQHQQFPGYRQELAGTDAGWGVMILPYIDRCDLWQDWKQGKVRKALLRLMICPSDPAKDLRPGRRMVLVCREPADLPGRQRPVAGLHCVQRWNRPIRCWYPRTCGA